MPKRFQEHIFLIEWALNVMCLKGSIPGPIVFLLHRNDCPVYILGPDKVLIPSVTNILIKTENEHNLNQKLNVNLK